MSTERQRVALTRHVLENRVWGDTPFFLLDVGCSGGIGGRWRIFGDRLKAVGFDPLVTEVERLNAANVHPDVVYEAAFVGCNDYDQLFPPALRSDRVASQDNQPFPRVTAAAAQRRLPTSYIQETFNAGAPIALANRFVTLDGYVSSEHHSQVDFVKIDTDGHDIEVVLGGEQIMAAGGVLGLMVEAQFQGATHEFANTFSNIDRILRRQGFTLFDLSTNRYSRTQLPAPFVSDLAAQTTSGQVLWGDAVYFRDLGSPDYERMWPGYVLTAERVMKLACLFELFKLPDCAAELLVNRGESIGEQQREELLDWLVSGEPGSYAAHVAAFDADFTSFYPSRRRRIESTVDDPRRSVPTDSALAPSKARRVPSKVSADEVCRLRERVARLKERNATLQERLKGRDAKVHALKDRVDRMESRRKRRRTSRIQSSDIIID